MGAVTSLLYGAEDPSIAGMVLDSAFSNLFNLMVELADLYDIRVPKFTVKMFLLYMRRVIQKKAKFDIMRLDCVKVARKSFVPALFAHGEDDKLILPKHSDAIFNGYMGNKNIIKFDGDHNSTRPKFYYEYVSNFFYSILRPPRRSSSYTSNFEKHCNARDLTVSAGNEENYLFRSVSAGASSSSSAPRSVSDSKSLAEFLSDFAPYGKDKARGPNEECLSLTSSTRETWGSCLSASGDDAPNQVLATPLWDSQHSTLDTPNDENVNKKKNKAPLGRKKSKREKCEKLEGLSQRLSACFLKSINHRRNYSS